MPETSSIHSGMNSALIPDPSPLYLWEAKCFN
uniref:Uncharacterized protein n=1 Tax=Arundo donax TaxID=35708 RepID=A0A0A9G5M8_ARUDO